MFYNVEDYLKSLGIEKKVNKSKSKKIIKKKNNKKKKGKKRYKSKKRIEKKYKVVKCDSINNKVKKTYTEEITEHYIQYCFQKNQEYTIDSFTKFINYEV